VRPFTVEETGRPAIWLALDFTDYIVGLDDLP
jgi:hypothetical protein